jgi:hypothetical protein
VRSLRRRSSSEEAPEAQRGAAAGVHDASKSVIDSGWAGESAEVAQPRRDGGILRISRGVEVESRRDSRLAPGVGQQHLVA